MSVPLTEVWRRWRERHILEKIQKNEKDKLDIRLLQERLGTCYASYT